jgi:Ulp1 family protease
MTLFLTDRLLTQDYMKELIRTNLVHYLENVMPNRMQKEERKEAKQEERRKEPKTVPEYEEESSRQEVRSLEEQWGQIASARELELTKEDLQTLKDFINDL